MAAPAHIARENGKKGGRPKGRKNNTTIEKELIKKHFEERILRATDSLINSQLLIAQGQTFLYKIEKKKVIGPKGGVSWIPQKPKLVTSQFEIESYLEGEIDGSNDIDEPGDTYYYFTTREPNNSAIDSLHDRVHGKATQALVTKDKEGNDAPIPIYGGNSTQI